VKTSHHPRPERIPRYPLFFPCIFINNLTSLRKGAPWPMTPSVFLSILAATKRSRNVKCRVYNIPVLVLPPALPSCLLRLSACLSSPYALLRSFKVSPHGFFKVTIPTYCCVFARGKNRLYSRPPFLVRPSRRIFSRDLLPSQPRVLTSNGLGLPANFPLFRPSTGSVLQTPKLWRILSV